MASAPCKGCGRRTVRPNCHMTCEAYLAFQAERQLTLDRHREAAELHDYIVDRKMYIRKTKSRFRKKSGRR